MTLPTFTLTGTVESLVGGTASPLAGAKVGFRSNIPAGSLIVAGGDLVEVHAVSVILGSDGSLPSMSLLANDASLNLETPVQWQVKIDGSPAWWFDAPAAGETVDLSTLTPVIGMEARGSVSGQAGGTQVIQSVQGPAGPSGPPLESLYRPLAGVRSDITSTFLADITPNYGSGGLIAYNSPGKFRYAGLATGTFSGSLTYYFNNNNNSPAFDNVTLNTWMQAQVIEFWSNATDLRIHFAQFQTGSTPAEDVWALCDDQRITPGFIHMGSNSSGKTTWKLTQSSAVWHKWRICIGGFLNGISVETGATVIPTSAVVPRVALIGASYVQGRVDTANAVSPGTTGRITAGTMWGEFEQITGLEVWRYGMYGTGYVNNAGLTNGAYGQRISGLSSAPTMKAVLVSGSFNDEAFSTDTVVAAAQSLWAAVKAAQPNASVIVLGAPKTGSLYSALAAAAVADSHVTSFVDMGSLPVLTGTGKDGSPAGDGNSDVFVSTDGLHPTHLGARHWGETYARVLGPVQLT